MQGDLAVQASTAFSRRQIGRGFGLLKRIGTKAEDIVDRIIKDCIKPDADKLQPGTALGGGSRRRLDFELLDDVGNVIKSIEVKNKIPSTGSAALRRLTEQLKDAQRAGRKDLSVVGGARVSDKSLEKTLDFLSRNGVDISALDVFNGFASFAQWGAEMYAEECFEIF